MNRIIFDDLTNYSHYPIYKIYAKNIKLRLFNGKEFIWINFFTQLNRVNGIWINKGFDESDANEQIRECLKDTPYIIVAWKDSKNSDNSIISLCYLDLCIIGIDEMYDDLCTYECKNPDWFKE